jgi:glycosyltransferase involved in cell wall biosynthesis
MKIVYVTKWISHDMGYIENCLPYAVASLGYEVHIITSTAQVYYNYPFYKEVYGSYLGEPKVSAGTYTHKNLIIHRLPFYQLKDHLVLKGLVKTITGINPDIVHVFEHTAIDTYKITALRLFKKFRFYTGNHAVLSVFPLAENWDNISLFRKIRWKLFTHLPGKIVSKFINKCYAVTEDAGYVATRFLGVSPKKVCIATLGVDTTLYFKDSETEKITKKLEAGFGKDDIVCIYTGRFTTEKNPLILAEAIAELAREGYPFKGLFVGKGEQRPGIEDKASCKVVDFVPYPQLPAYYQTADIGIWPGQESTSQLDAVASGVNLILTDNIKAYDLADSGTTTSKPKIVSRFYRHLDKEDLKKQLLSLLDPHVREHLAYLGVSEIKENYSWLKIAERRVADYMS